MNSSFTYPVVTYPQIVNLFHAILFFRYEQKLQENIEPRFWFTTFNTVWSLLAMNCVLPEERIKNLRGNRQLCRLFLKDTHVVAQWDNREWDVILNDAGLHRFCVRIGNRELTAGSTVNYLELCNRTPIFITRFGIKTASLTVRKITPLLTREQFLSAWEIYTAGNKYGLGGRMKSRNRKLDMEIWGDTTEETVE